MMRKLVIMSSCVAVLWCAPALGADAPAQGRDLFVHYGCYQCHGYVGQGGREGVKLAPDPLPYDALSAFVRGTTGAMPAYTADLLPDADLAKIYAYLKSIKPTKPVDSIPLLKDLR